jgi:glycosyltransferase involved in cell wall biosynthesis
MIKISAVIITYNEEKNIARCLQSLGKVADEIIVVDSFSTDTTRMTCEKFNVKFTQHQFEGYGLQKNFGDSLAQYDYILSLDADEALSDELVKLILEFKNNPRADVVSMKRLTNYCGQWIRHSGWYPDIKTRLWKRGYAAWNTNLVHESLILKPDATKLFFDADILHYSYYTIAEHRERTLKYAGLASRCMAEEGKDVSMPMIYIKTAFKFLRNYFLFLGFLDGMNGFTISRMSAYETYLKYHHLFELNKKARN